MKGTCAYCGTVGDVTADHVFSRGLFPETYIRKPNVLIVPACSTCNNGFSADEEHFRVFLINLSAEYSKEADDILFSKIKRSIEKAPGKGHNILANMELVNLFDPEGNFLGEKTKIHISEDDWRRHHRVLDKYIKGLFFALKGRVIPSNYRLRHILAKPEKLAQFAAQIPNYNLDEKEIVVYGSNFIPNSDTSIWLTVFYDQVAFQTFMVTEEHMAEFEKRKHD